MKKLCYLFLCLALISLACLDTVVDLPITKTPGAAAPTLTNLPTAAARILKVDPTLTNAPLVCARVIAETAEHLRIDADYHSRSLTHLRSGQIVFVVDQANPDWWLVVRGAYYGYARSIYLKEVECANKN
jgi:hypothetical protein